MNFFYKYTLSSCFSSKNISFDNILQQKEKEKEINMEEQIQKLRSIDHKKVPLFSFQNKVLIARVVDVYDGDTCTVLFEYNGEIIKYKSRAMGYDCAEMKPKKDDPNRDQEKKLALAAKARFIELMGGSDAVVKMKCLDFDKYGRILAYFYKLSDDVEKDASVNSIMIQEGHGKAYEGGTKEEW
jgi:endonuclease YncB( thermonuclease family)